MFAECHVQQVRKIAPRPEAQRSFSRSPCRDVISSGIHEMSQITEDTKANSVNVGAVQMSPVALMRGVTAQRCLGGTVNSEVWRNICSGKHFSDL